jgi:uncharacterized protein
MLASAPRCRYHAAVPFDPVAEDPPSSEGPPASLMSLRFSSHGEGLNGVLYGPAGTRPHPTVLVLHGFAGYERNIDLAQACRRAGWNALVFHYRGSWGSDGSYSFGHVLEDVGAALEAVRSAEATETWGIDGERIVLVGHSMGGFAALMTVRGDRSLLGAGSVAGFNLGMAARLAEADPAFLAAATEMLQSNLAPLRGTSAETLLEEIRHAGVRWDLAALASDLADRPILLIGATRDAEAPLHTHHEPLVRALKDAGASRLTNLVLETDHAFSDQRIAMTRAVLHWLTTLG